MTLDEYYVKLSVSNHREDQMNSNAKYVSDCGDYTALTERVKLWCGTEQTIWVVRDKKDNVVDITMHETDLDGYNFSPMH